MAVKYYEFVLKINEKRTKELLLNESAKLRALRAWCLTCPVLYVLSRLTCLMPYVSRVLRTLVHYVLPCPTCLVPYMLSCLTCLMLYVPCVLRASCQSCSCVSRVLRRLFCQNIHFAFDKRLLLLR